MREGGSPWLLRLVDGAGTERSVVLRDDHALGSAGMRTELAGLAAAAGGGVPVPAVLASDIDGDPPRLLMEAVAGSSAIPVAVPRDRLRRLGALAASIHAIRPPVGADLPARDRPIQPVDFAALRASAPPDPLAARAEALVAARRLPGSGEGLVHGDLWQGNVLWRGDTLVAVLDWDCAGRGPAGVDLGALRCDASMCFGPGAADDVLDGWQERAGQSADDVAYWDVVAALSTPPDMGWFPPTFADQGRPDLTAAVLIDRRDRFLAAAVDLLRHR